jgi:AbrB family looped-hinge helix DNA binding protein
MSKISGEAKRTHVSSRGQVVIPQEIREKLHLKEGTELDVEIESDHLVLRKAKTSADWRSWQGKFRGVDLTKAREEERRAEESRERKKGS